MNQSIDSNRFTTRAKCVCIWIGNLQSEVELDDYLYFDFAKDYEGKPEESNLPESHVSSRNELVSDLLKGFSQSENFLELAVKKANNAGILDGQAAVVFYSTFFDDTNLSSQDNPRMTFIGNVEW